MPFCRGSESQRSIYLIVLYDTIIIDSDVIDWECAVYHAGERRETAYQVFFFFKSCRGKTAWEAEFQG
jgi:hypothetical protein